MLPLLGATILATWLFLREWFYNLFCSRKLNEKKTIGLFHPYCNAGGGGERVLWAIVKFLCTKYESSEIIVYTGDVDISASTIRTNVNRRFNMEVPDRVKFVYLKRRHWVEAGKYPHLTLLGQSIGSIVLALEAVSKAKPDVFIDTMGYAFSYPVFKILCNCNVACYVHYPTISSDMLNKVLDRQKSFNNSNVVAESKVLSSFKYRYYCYFAKLYSWVGSYSDIVMVNSSWTEGHIKNIWKNPSNVHKVYPPCDVSDFKTIENISESLPCKRIVSLGQFRPEKDHKLQIHSYKKLTEILDDAIPTKLVIIGSCRNEEDEERVKELQLLVAELDLTEQVNFLINVSFSQLQAELSRCLIGLHTMWNEHFGIGVVELMASGVITIAHKSGGPMMDIVQTERSNQSGFLSETSEEYAATMHHIISLSSKERNQIRNCAKYSCDRFTEAQFLTRLESCLVRVMD